MKVFKFGGASIKDAEAVKNVGEIITGYPDQKILIVISAVGKSTNKLEEITQLYIDSNSELASKIATLKKEHINIVESLSNDHKTDETKIIFEQLKVDIEKIFGYLEKLFSNEANQDYDIIYDQVVPVGELLSTKIVSAYLNSINLLNSWTDARKLILTDSSFRNAEVDWQLTEMSIQNLEWEENLIVTQGFIGGTKGNFMTTLGREGSDYSAAIFSNLLSAESLTIWKDVDGVLNADPKFFNNTIKLDNISYKEAIELAYFGASVIHPKTIKPVQNKNIPLWVKSFINANEPGTLINDNTDKDDEITKYIFKSDQVLMSFSPKDFSFIKEKNISEIFDALAGQKLEVSTIQNSAINFSISVDYDKNKIEKLLQTLQEKYTIKYNQGLELLTIRHFDDETLAKLINGRQVFLEQKSRNTVRVLMY
jgi:aspartate kinase|tara:strand:+ start:20430 stop:21704 length:1275 start_codon:yes stop_codon:yes gene_type:complete